MTEDEIRKLEQEVFFSDPAAPGDPDIEREWLETQRAGLLRSAEEMRAAFRLHKFLRDDARMQTVAADLTKAKNALGYIAGRLHELAGSKRDC